MSDLPRSTLPSLAAIMIIGSNWMFSNRPFACNNQQLEAWAHFVGSDRMNCLLCFYEHNGAGWIRLCYRSTVGRMCANVQSVPIAPSKSVFAHFDWSLFIPFHSIEIHIAEYWQVTIMQYQSFIWAWLFQRKLVHRPHTYMLVARTSNTNNKCRYFK